MKNNQIYQHKFEKSIINTSISYEVSISYEMSISQTPNSNSKLFGIMRATLITLPIFMLSDIVEVVGIFYYG